MNLDNVLATLKKEFKTVRSTKIVEKTDAIEVVYHATVVARVEVWEAGDDHCFAVTINTGGHRTSTTKSRINDTLAAAGKRERVCQKNFSWFIASPDSTLDGKPFVDGMVIAN